MTRGGEATPGLSGPLALLPLGHSAQISVPHTKPVFAGLGEQGMRRPAQGSPVSEVASRDPGHTCCLEQPGVGIARPSGSGSLCAGEPTLAHLSHTSASTVVGGPVPVLLLHLCPHSASSPCSRGQAVRVSLPREGQACSLRFSVTAWQAARAEGHIHILTPVKLWEATRLWGPRLRPSAAPHIRTSALPLCGWGH